MKIKFEPYNAEWKLTFSHLKEDLNRLIGFLNPQIEHIGSTSVEGLAAKPIIDILVGLESENDLDKVVAPLTENGYVYYEIYNQYLSDRRFFVKHRINREELLLPSIFRDGDEVPSDTNEHDHRLAHIHIWPRSSAHWTRHIAFREYLRKHPDVKNEYGKLKANLSLREWRDGNDYNEAKDAFIKGTDQKVAYSSSRIGYLKSISDRYPNKLALKKLFGQPHKRRGTESDRVVSKNK